MIPSGYDILIRYSPINEYCTLIYIYSTISFLISYYSIASYFSLHPSKLSPLVVPTKEYLEVELKKEKMRAWIVTAISSLGMTVSSLPFCVDLLMGGGDVSKVQARETLSQGLTASFMAYLLCDCMLGYAHYRSQFNLLTGWIHHSCYTVLLTFILRANIAKCFSLAAIMELPTFVLALAMVVPATRNDELFSILFFLTRIVLHCVFACLYGSSYGQLHASGLLDTEGLRISTSLPLVGLILAAPMHIMWFASSTKGLLKRRAAARVLLLSTQTSLVNAEVDVEVEQILIQPSTLPSPPSPYLSPLQSEKLVSIATSYISSSSRRISNSIPLRRTLVTPTFNKENVIPSNNPNFDFLVRDYFNLRLLDHENRRTMMTEAGIGNTSQMIQNFRIRAGRGGDEIKRFGGRLRRRVGGLVS